LKHLKSKKDYLRSFFRYDKDPKSIPPVFEQPIEIPGETAIIERLEKENPKDILNSLPLQTKVQMFNYLQNRIQFP